MVPRLFLDFQKIQYFLFGNIVSWNYDGLVNFRLYTVGQIDADFTAGKVESLLNQAQIGDILQLQNGNGYSQHTMIFGGRISGGFIIYDSNWDRENTVFIRNERYDTFG